MADVGKEIAMRVCVCVFPAKARLILYSTLMFCNVLHIFLLVDIW